MIWYSDQHICMKFNKTQLIGKNTEYVLLFMIFIIAFGLRMYQSIHQWALPEEATVYSIATTYDFHHLLFLKHWDLAHPPLLYMFERLILVLNGFQYISIHVLRFPFIIISSLTVFPLYFFVRSIFGRSTTFLFIPLWYAVNSFQIYMGFMVRPYSILQFLFFVCAFAFYDSLWLKRKYIVLFNVLFTFMFYWDYASVWFFLLFSAYTILTYIRTPAKILKRFVQLMPFVFAVLAWMPIFISHFSAMLALFNFQGMNISELYAYISGMNINFVIRNFTIAVILHLSVIFLNLRYSFQKQKWPLVLLLSGIGMPIIVHLIFGMLVQNLFVPRNMLFSSLCMLVILGSLLQNTNRHRMWYGLLITLLFVVSMFHVTGSWVFPQYTDFTYRKSELLIDVAGSKIPVISFKGDYDYLIIYELLKRKYRAVANTKDKFLTQKGFQKFELIYFPLRSTVDTDSIQTIRNTMSTASLIVDTFNITNDEIAWLRSFCHTEEMKENAEQLKIPFQIYTCTL